MDIIRKIQNQPEKIRKIILWSIIVFLGFIFLFLWMKSLRARLEATKEGNIFEELKLPQFEEKIKNLPKTEIPTPSPLSEEELKILEEELLKESEQK